MTTTGIPALTLADVRRAHPGWDIHIRRSKVWAVKRGTIDAKLRASTPGQADSFITAFEQAAA
jgi:hypothetical protein